MTESRLSPDQLDQVAVWRRAAAVFPAGATALIDEFPQTYPRPGQPDTHPSGDRIVAAAAVEDITLIGGGLAAANPVYRAETPPTLSQQTEGRPNI